MKCTGTASCWKTFLTTDVHSTCMNSRTTGRKVSTSSSSSGSDYDGDENDQRYQSLLTDMREAVLSGLLERGEVVAFKDGLIIIIEEAEALAKVE